MDAFAELGLERRLAVSGEEIREAFREAGKRRHPDAGGEAEDFSKLQEAERILSDPGARLRHWLRLEGVEGEMRGAVSAGLMDVFGKIGGALQEADALIRERERASSALAKAMLEGRTQACREKLEACQALLEIESDGRTGDLPLVEEGLADGWVLARELAFLGKWKAQVRERFAALW
jgi:curved DNA-binding protein CbpA